MARNFWRDRCSWTVILLGLWGSATVSGQDSGGPIIRDSSVGYINSAVLGDYVRLRFDSADNNVRPSRAEYFYPRSGAAGPGPPRPETSVDYQDLSVYVESRWTDRLSVFVDGGVRFLDPEANANTAGIGDLNSGVKYLLMQVDETVLTSQLRIYAPTGDARRGLGTDHVSIEPGMLLFAPCSEQVGMEAEVRLWVPVGGTELAGSVIQYGVGAFYEPDETSRWTPVVEVVGWSVLDGGFSRRLPSGEIGVEDATGDTIVNLKLGTRLEVNDRADLYFGYGRALTGDTWYDQIFRAELRYSF